MTALETAFWNRFDLRTAKDSNDQWGWNGRMIDRETNESICVSGPFSGGAHHAFPTKKAFVQACAKIGFQLLKERA